MRKAGLCVRYDCNNFGSMLQILATQKALNMIGWNYEIIRYDKRTPLFYLTNVTRVFNPYFMKGKIAQYNKKRRLHNYPEVEKGNRNRMKCISEYRRKYIGPYSPIFRGYSSLKAGIKDYDAVIVGSDQLWTPAGIKSKFYNLLFVPDSKKKVSFATSFGVSEIPKSQRKMTSSYLKRIDYISVRETRGAEIVKELTHRDATVVLDPTLLITGEEWRHIFPEKRVINGPYILAYFLGSNEEHRDVVEKLKEHTGLRIITIPFMDVFVKRDLSFGDDKMFDLGPIEFLNLIRGAEYVCTDSFHGTVFSILYHKRFITFDRMKNGDKLSRNSRIDSLFGILGLGDRRYHSNMDIYKSINKDIDYTRVNNCLFEQRKNAFAFLQKALNE